MILDAGSGVEAARVACWIADEIGGGMGGLAPNPLACFRAFVDVNGGPSFAAAVAFAWEPANPRGALLAIAAPKPSMAFRNLIRRALDCAFGELGLARLTATVVASNRRSERLAKAIGFVSEGRLRVAGPDGQDLLVFGLLPADRRF